MMNQSRIYKGIEYVQLSELPSDQQDLITRSKMHELIIKILVDGKIVNDCIQFKDYQDWYEHQFDIRKTSSIPNEVKQSFNTHIPQGVQELVAEKM